jgi:hypothetical protein
MRQGDGAARVRLPLPISRAPNSYVIGTGDGSRSRLRFWFHHVRRTIKCQSLGATAVGRGYLVDPGCRCFFKGLSKAEDR